MASDMELQMLRDGRGNSVPIPEESIDFFRLPASSGLVRCQLWSLSTLVGVKTFPNGCKDDASIVDFPPS